MGACANGGLAFYVAQVPNTQYFAKSISMVYPSKSTRMNISTRAKLSVNACASFCKSFFFFVIRLFTLEIDSYEHFRTCKMISESVRIFLYKYIIFHRPPNLPFLNFCNFWKISKRYFNVFGRFSQLISISVSAVACS